MKNAAATLSLHKFYEAHTISLEEIESVGIVPYGANACC